MAKRGIETLVAEHAFFRDMPENYRSIVACCGKNVRFEPGQSLARTGDPADRFYAIRHGRVAIELHSSERGPLILQTLEAGDIVGWSWLFPPYRWTFDVRATEQVRAVSFDGECLRRKCDDDPVMGYDFMKRFAQTFMRRLQAARVQLLDLYGEPSQQ